jgi:hypothetical protein
MVDGDQEQYWEVIVEEGGVFSIEGVEDHDDREGGQGWHRERGSSFAIPPPFRK